MTGLQRLVLALVLAAPAAGPAATASADHGWYVELGRLVFTGCSGAAADSALDYEVSPRWDQAAGTFSGRATAVRGGERRDVGTISGKSEPGRLTFRIVEQVTIDAVASLPIGGDGRLAGVATGRTDAGSAFSCNWSRVAGGGGVPLSHEATGSGGSSSAPLPIGLLPVALLVMGVIAFFAVRALRDAAPERVMTPREAHNAERLRSRLVRATPRSEGPDLRMRVSAGTALLPLSAEPVGPEAPESEEPEQDEVAPDAESGSEESIGGLADRLRESETSAIDPPGTQPQERAEPAEHVAVVEPVEPLQPSEPMEPVEPLPAAESPDPWLDIKPGEDIPKD